MARLSPTSSASSAFLVIHRLCRQCSGRSTISAVIRAVRAVGTWSAAATWHPIRRPVFSDWLLGRVQPRLEVSNSLNKRQREDGSYHAMPGWGCGPGSRSCSCMLTEYSLGSWLSSGFSLLLHVCMASFSLPLRHGTQHGIAWGRPGDFQLWRAFLQGTKCLE